MELKTFQAAELSAALDEVRALLGQDAVIVHTRRFNRRGESVVEVVATTEADMAPLRRAMALDGTKRPGGKGSAAWPRTVALVGPTGAGKTTTLIKLALHANAFGTGQVGLATLDTYRVGAVEQIQTYADIAHLPLEVVYHADDVSGAVERLSQRDVVLVDAPGRGPRREDAREWPGVLRRFVPDEVYLVLPAAIRPEVAVATRDLYLECGLTHLVVTKLDELPDPRLVTDLAALLDLPVAWVTDGQRVPADLRRGGASLLASLSLTASESFSYAAG